MFEPGTYVVCGQHGVCKIESIGKLNLSEATKDKDYYTMSKVYAQGGFLYVPADSDKIVIRPVLTADEAKQLIAEMPEIAGIVIENEKKKDEIIKQAFKTCDNRQWVSVIKSLHERKRARIARGKKVTASDERYLKTAEDNLFSEMALALGIGKKEVGKYILNCLEGQPVS